jgi:predicted metalloendopeptidase
VIHQRNIEIQKHLYSGNHTKNYSMITKEEMVKVKRFYSSCMDHDARSSRGVQHPSFVADLAEIADIADVKDLLRVHSSFLLKGFNLGLYDHGIGADLMDPHKNIAWIGQGGLTLPTRDYYGVGEEGDNERFQQVRAAFVEFMTRAFNMSGVSGDPQKVLDFETQLANASWSAVRMRDPVKTYFPTTYAAFQSNFSSFETVFTTLRGQHPKMTPEEKMAYCPPDFFSSLETLLEKTELATLKAYLSLNYLKQTLSYLNEEAGDLGFEMFGKVLNGMQERPKLWKRCVGATSSATWAMSDKMFVEDHFGQESKDMANEMIKYIKNAFEARLNKLDFMDNATLWAAKEKLHAMRAMIGFPEEWPDYEDLQTVDDFFKNQMSSHAVEAARKFARIGSRVDPDKWEMKPSDVNAYYQPSKNLMAFPAGILQPPFFHRDAPMVLNFAAVGAIMGHELTHGFDDQGAMYGPGGQLKMWWTNTSIAKFTNKTACVINQYQSMEVPELKGVADAPPINGQLTLGENIADIGGLATAFDAYEQWKKDKDTPTTFQVGNTTMSDTELFWLANGQSWCAIMEPMALMVRLRSDPHSPHRARVVGPPQNSLAFGQTMNCSSGTVMNPAGKCKVW